MRPLTLDRNRILAYRRRATALDERWPPGARSLRRAAWAGLQDSVPRAALLSMHARVGGVRPTTWEAPSLVQVWGPRFNAYVVPRRDLAVFTLGRLPDAPGPRQRAIDISQRLIDTLAGERLDFGTAARRMREPSPNRLRYAAVTGTVAMRWDGARQPVIWTLPQPEVDPTEARLELARRYLHVFGVGTSASFAAWAGVHPAAAAAAFTALRAELLPVTTPIGSASMRREDEPAMRAAPGDPARARLLPSGDTWFLLQGDERTLLVPDARWRRALWPSRVWPGALLVDGETSGTWRRASHVLTLQPWRRLSRPQREAVEAEAASLPLPDLTRPLDIRWDPH